MKVITKALLGAGALALSAGIASALSPGDLRTDC